MNKYPKFEDEVIINKEIKYTVYGTEYETYNGQRAFANDDYDEEKDELYVGLLDRYGALSDFITVKLEDIYWPNED